MNCPNCQTPLRDGAQFCTRCGARTSPSAADSVPTAEGGRGADARAGGAAGADRLEGRVLDGKYEITGPIGEGGMGAVYRARRVHIGDEVAVKVLHSKFVGDPTLVERFRREARAAAQLHHPNVVTIHDYGEAVGPEGFAYIVMELVRGLPLRELLRREGRLSVERSSALVRDICAGVGAAHRREIVHRDLKPDNIIVLPADDDRERESVKVVDFGIAKLRDMASDSTLTQAGSMVGTPYYMSPEQCRGEPLDARADVYSLGAMLYEMLAGAPPFTAPTVTGVIAKHLTEPAPPLPGGPGAPAALQAVVSRALSKDPAARQRDAAEFGREVQAAAAQPAGGAVPTEPTPAPESFFPATGRQVTPSAPPQTSAAPAVGRATQPPGQQAQAYAPGPPQHAAAAPPRRKSRMPLYLGLTVLVVAALAAFVGGGLYFIGRQQEKKRAANVNAPPRATPTPSPTPRPVNVSPAMERAERKLLTGAALAASDLSALSPTELRLLRNVPFARDGRPFKEPDLVAYFASRPWYAPRADYAGSTLTQADETNLALIRSVETGGAPPPQADPAALRREVKQALDGWAKSTRDRDLHAHAGFYADTLETFYQRQNVPSAQVLTDRARAFTRYEDLKVEIENVEITPHPTNGARAVATFDKRWTFEADDKTSSGSVRQQLVFVKVEGRWVITAEKDLQVYSKSSEEY